MKIKYLLLFLLFSSNAGSQILDDNTLKQLIKNNSVFSHSLVGISVFDLKNEKIISSYNGDKNFVPASVLKILYTLSSVDTKGKDFTFDTKVSYTGEILYDGSLQGNLIITASGDPTFGSPRFYKGGFNTVMRNIKESITKAGITCIDGDIILELPDQSYPVNGSWTVEDIGNYYAGGAWDFNFNDNEYRIKFKLNNSTNSNTKIIEITPEIPGLEIINQVRVGKRGTGDNSYIYGLPYSFRREVKGTLPIGKHTYTIRGAIPNPPLTFIRILANYLDKNNFYFSNVRVSKQAILDKKHLLVLKSPKLIEIAKTCSNWSINLYSEALAKLLCLKSNHPNDYIYKHEIASFFIKYGINSTKTQIVDGCGLSFANHISPNTLTNFINEMTHRLGLHTVLEILPAAGIEGYAKKITISHLWIKSGSVQGVLNYSGIFKAKNGKYFAFSIMTNNNNDKLKKKIKTHILKLLKTIINQSA